MGRGRGATLEMNPSVEAAPPPEESGGENAASLFDATADARIRILRRDESNQRFVTHGYLPPDANEETVNAMFGGGYYKAQLVIPDPTSGRLVIKRARDFKIPGAYKPPQKINTFEDAAQNGANASQAAAAAVPTLPAGVAGGGDLMAVLNAGVVSTLLDLLKTTKEINSRPAQSADPMMLKLMEAQAATQQKMMEFMLTLATKDSGGNDRKSILAELAQMKELFASPSNGVVPADPMKMFDNMLQTFRSFKDAAEEVSPHNDGGDPLFSSIPKVVEVLVEQHNMSKAAAAAGQQRVVRRAVPGPAGGTAQMPEVSTINPPQPEQLAMWQMILRQQSKRLVASAAAKHDPDVIAGTAILFAPPPVLEALKIFFHREEAEVSADILAEVPAMVDHPEWLSDFIACAQERLFPDEFADDDDAPEGEATGGGE